MNETLHWLENDWAFWVDERGPMGLTKTEYENKIKNLGEFSTIEDFWKYMNNLTLDSLPVYFNLRLFKNGIKPSWEDPANEGGGSWIVYSPKSKTIELWKKLVLIIIGESLVYSEDLCGVVMSLRPKKDMIKIWNNCCHNQSRNSRMSEELTKLLDLDKYSLKLIYQQHENDTPPHRSPKIPPSCNCNKKNMKRNVVRNFLHQKTNPIQEEEKLDISSSRDDGYDSDEDNENNQQDNTHITNESQTDATSISEPTNETVNQIQSTILPESSLIRLSLPIEDENVKCWGDYSEEEIDDEEEEQEQEIKQNERDLRKRAVNNTWRSSSSGGRRSKSTNNIRNSDDSLLRNQHGIHKKSNSYSPDVSPTNQSSHNRRGSVPVLKNASSPNQSGRSGFRGGKGNMQQYHPHHQQQQQQQQQQHRRSSSSGLSKNDPPFVIIRRQLGGSPNTISPILSPVNSLRDASPMISYAAAVGGIVANTSKTGLRTPLPVRPRDRDDSRDIGREKIIISNENETKKEIEKEIDKAKEEEIEKEKEKEIEKEKEQENCAELQMKKLEVSGSENEIKPLLQIPKHHAYPQNIALPSTTVETNNNQPKSVVVDLGEDQRNLKPNKKKRGPLPGTKQNKRLRRNTKRTQPVKTVTTAYYNTRYLSYLALLVFLTSVVAAWALFY